MKTLRIIAGTLCHALAIAAMLIALIGLMPQAQKEIAYGLLLFAGVFTTFCAFDSVRKYPRIVIRIRRAILHGLWGKSPDYGRMQWWSNLDQQEKYPGDMGFSYAKDAACPLRYYRIGKRFTCPDKSLPVWTPQSVLVEALKKYRPFYMHPEWKLAVCYAGSVASLPLTAVLDYVRSVAEPSLTEILLYATNVTP